MIETGILLALVCLGVCVAYRHRQSQAQLADTVQPSAPAPAPIVVAGPVAAPPPRPLDTVRLETVNAFAAERLWRLAFGAPALPQPITAEHSIVRDAILTVLRADKLDPEYLPRRPALMPQLLRAVNDPNVAPDKVSRIIAQDPVLTADVLRLANSSLYRMTTAPVETIQRAVVICGADGLQALLATAMLQPVFRATDDNFPRFARLLWDRTERAARAAELYAMKTQREDRFEAQLLALLAALGPLVVYRASLHMYAKFPGVAPNPSLCVAMVAALGGRMSQRIAQQWQSSPRIVAALEQTGEQAGEPTGEQGLTTALHVGELLGSLSILEMHQEISAQDSIELAAITGVPDELSAYLRQRLHSNVGQTADTATHRALLATALG